MEMWDGRLRLITVGMEEEGCYYQHCCRCGGAGGEAGSHRQTTMIQRLQRDNTRLRRMAQCIAVALFFLIALFLAFLGALVLQVRGHQSPASQPAMQPNSPSSHTGAQQQRDEALGSPSALLTVSYPRKVNGSRLEWDSETGHAFCHGGFKYSNGNLTVPRSGIYRVYLQITYHDEGCHDNDHITLTNEVRVWQDTYHKDVPLLSAADTVSCGGESWTKSLYTSGSFDLEANSLLHVVSSHITLIAKNQHQVFFGAELLS